MAAAGIRRRLPDVVVEAVMIFLAVILALATEEWRERRDHVQLADRAMRAIGEETRSNLAELERTGLINTGRLEAARDVLQQLEAGQELVDVEVGLEVALLSSAAWQSAQMSQAVQYLDLELMRQLSEAYEVQALYERMQLSLVDRIGDLTRVAQEDPAAAIRQGVGGVSMLLGLHDSLAEVYLNTLAELDSVDAGPVDLTEPPTVSGRTPGSSPRPPASPMSVP